MNMHYPFVRDKWKAWPAEPQLAIEGDPGELDDLDERSEEWWKENRRLRRKAHKEGREFTRDEIEAEYRKWKAKHGRA